MIVTLSERLAPLVMSGFSGLWVRTWEPHAAQEEVNRLCHTRGWHSVRWDVSSGVSYPHDGTADKNSTDPRAVLAKTWDKRSLVCLHLYHRFLDNPQVVQALVNSVLAGRGMEHPHHYLVLTHEAHVPAELEKYLTVVDHPLPSREALGNVLRSIDGGENLIVQEGSLDAATGLTGLEAENAFALSIHLHGEVRRDVVWGQKVQAVRKKGFLELYQGSDSFSSLGGLAGAKDFCRRLLRPGCPITPRGVLLVGLSGTGKSAFAKALGNEVGRPTLLMDVGRLHSKYVGDTENNLRAALELAEAVSPCCLFVDEVEKALAGVGSDGDSGVSTRVFGSLLTWMQDHTSDVFVVMSSNDVSRLPPEFTRQGRVDRVFMAELPDDDEKNTIWGIHLRNYTIDVGDQVMPEDQDWTGSEIEACCRLSKALGVSLVESAEGIVPVARSASEAVARLRAWAKDRVIDAGTGKPYKGVPVKTGRTRGRNVARSEETT